MSLASPTGLQFERRSSPENSKAKGEDFLSGWGVAARIAVAAVGQWISPFKCLDRVQNAGTQLL
jgi:hypothetical protein